MAHLKSSLFAKRDVVVIFIFSTYGHLHLSRVLMNGSQGTFGMSQRSKLALRRRLGVGYFQMKDWIQQYLEEFIPVRESRKGSGHVRFQSYL